MHVKRFEAKTLKAALARIRSELGPDTLILESRPANPDRKGGGVEVLAAIPHPAAETSSAPIVQGLPADGSADRRRIEYLSRLVRTDHFSAVPVPWREIYLDLVEAEVDSNLAFELLSRLIDSSNRGGQTVSGPRPMESVMTGLQRLVRVGGAVAAGQPRRVLALIGPTGVGKTTTVAKIAGSAAFELGLRVALVTTDSYRVFGAQHLESYARLMGLPFHRATRSGEMATLLDQDLNGFDLILVDTSGRSPSDPEGIAEIHSVLGACPDVDIHLVLAANVGARDLARAYESYSQLPIRHLIFSKLDESSRRGGIFTLALKARRPVSYLTDGQEVPEDLEPATIERLTENLIPPVRVEDSPHV